MKLLFSLLAILMLSKECENKNTSSASEEVNTTEQSQKMASMEKAQNEMTITYEASTRGYFHKVWVTKDTIRTTTDRYMKSIEGYPCPEKDWEELMEAMKDIKLTSLSELEPPSKAFQYDGAAMASLKVQDGDVIYATPIFDNGNPPKSIAAVVKKVLSLGEMVEKQ
ncbi:hypothetical protein [Winogradskyella sp. 3972H.M.0a.05]|uniref:hypothetical protein n=1 Tax=Winogradskyella sp. 3972H.M.0a.05 TaxID=2950277 RepID=UPI00339ADCE7